MGPDEFELMENFMKEALQRLDYIELKVDAIKDTVTDLSSRLASVREPLMMMADHFNKAWMWVKVGLGGLLYTNVIHTGQAGKGLFPFVRRLATAFIEVTKNGRGRKK